MRSKQFEDKYLIRLDLGEKVRETLDPFLEEQQIKAGILLQGIGAVSKVEIAHYPLSQRQYHKQTFSGEFEVVSLSGNLARVDQKPFLHMHIALGRSKQASYELFGGHLVEATVGPTLELFLQTLPGELTRTLDPEVGLKLLDW